MSTRPGATNQATPTTIRPWHPGDPHPPGTVVAEASAFEEVVRDFCDHHGGYVDAGTTRPYTADRSAHAPRACAGCLALMRDEVLARETYHDECGYLSAFHVDGRCPTELEARRLGGDR